MKDQIKAFVTALLDLDRLAIKRIQASLLERLSPIAFIDTVVVKALEEIGDGWHNGEYALSQIYMAGRICEKVVDELLPPGDPQRKDQPKIAICVLKDHHKLGKTIVTSQLRAGGYDVLDYDVVEVEELVDRVMADGIKILLISVLMLHSARLVADVTGKLAAENADVKVVVGGAPFRLDDTLWKSVGADAFCKTASEVLSVIKRMERGERSERMERKDFGERTERLVEDTK